MARLYHHTLGAVERLFIDGTFGFTIEANLLESFTGQRLLKGERVPWPPQKNDNK